MLETRARIRCLKLVIYVITNYQQKEVLPLPLIHIIGFGDEVKIGIKSRRNWFPQCPTSELTIESGDSIILNLISIYHESHIKAIKRPINQLLQTGGTLITVMAPFKNISRNLFNYSFLPWDSKCTESIGTHDTYTILIDTNAPLWAKRHFSRFRNQQVAPAFFDRLPSGSHILARSGGGAVSLIFQDREGRIILLPTLPSIMHQTRSKNEEELLSDFLTSLVEIISVFGKLTEKEPSWLSSIQIRNEAELRDQFENITNQLESIHELKSILNDFGKVLTRKVADIFHQLGFQSKDLEIEGYEDIELILGDFRAIVECSGSKGFFSMEKLRQLIHYLLDKGVGEVKGIFVGNPWRHIHPGKRELQNAFTTEVIKAAEKLNICLVTVPHLLRVFLDSDVKDYEEIQKSLMVCKGLWQYPASSWD